MKASEKSVICFFDIIYLLEFNGFVRPKGYINHSRTDGANAAGFGSPVRSTLLQLLLIYQTVYDSFVMYYTSQSIFASAAAILSLQLTSSASTDLIRRVDSNQPLQTACVGFWFSGDTFGADECVGSNQAQMYNTRTNLNQCIVNVDGEMKWRYK
jgi:hypothetical protein